MRAHAALEQLRAGRHEGVAHDLARTLPLAWTEQRRALGFPTTGTATSEEPGPCL